ncbi:diadenylate cyclase CdaA [candidate division FCPU426 bacterium]|nr:diadenylate cyclase CdaA [candidate division FCPU426 bacterium]
MPQELTRFTQLLIDFRWQDGVDILLVTILLYRILLMIRDTKAMQMLKGFLVLLIFAFIGSQLQLYTINWLLTSLWAVWLIAFTIIFQPELRRVLIQLGRRRMFLGILKEEARLYKEITEACRVLARRKIGALIVLERDVNLKNYIDTGTIIDAELTAELMVTLFVPKTPLHDGAVIIREWRAVAAGCILPLTQDLTVAKNYGTRHRAAIGLTEETDAVAIVVSEENRSISLAVGGKITPAIDSQTLEEMLTLYGPKRG